MIPAVLAAAEEDWSGSPLAREVSRFLEARVAAGEVVTAAELDELDAGLQPLVRELFDGTDVATRAALQPALEQWQTTTIDIDFFRELGRVVVPGRAAPGDARRRPGRGGRRARRRALGVAGRGRSCSSASRESARRR